MMERISLTWCRVMHRGAMWPMHGVYICPRCLRKHVVAWDESNEAVGPGEAAHRTETRQERAAIAVASGVTLLH